MLTQRSAKYIEGLENRLGRMESLLKLSGLLNEEDGDKDLGTLERRLADKTYSQTGSGSPPERSKSVSSPRTVNESQQTTPQVEKLATPMSSTTSPEPPKEAEEEVEALSDMMCSLVTNNCGESRYIGMLCRMACLLSLILCRIIVRLLDLFPQGNSMG